MTIKPLSVHRISQAAAQIGRSVGTLRDWDSSGKLVPSKTATGKRVTPMPTKRKALAAA